MSGKKKHKYAVFKALCVFDHPFEYKQHLRKRKIRFDMSDVNVEGKSEYEKIAACTEYIKNKIVDNKFTMCEIWSDTYHVWWPYPCLDVFAIVVSEQK